MASKSSIEAALKALTNYGPCDVADALLKYGIADGGFFPNLTQYSKGDKPTIGTAYTVTYAPVDDPRPALKTAYIDQVPKGLVVVIGLTPAAQLQCAPYTSITNALYGGLMSTRANYLGAAGTVVFGKIRDVDEHRALGYNVWSYGLGICAPKGAVKVVAINEPLQIAVKDYHNSTGYQLILPGDIIVGDENGIARIPISEGDEWLEKVVSYIPKRVAADELVAEDIKNGQPAALSQKLRRLKL